MAAVDGCHACRCCFGAVVANGEGAWYAVLSAPSRRRACSEACALKSVDISSSSTAALPLRSAMARRTAQVDARRTPSCSRQRELYLVFPYRAEHSSKEALITVRRICRQKEEPFARRNCCRVAWLFGCLFAMRPATAPASRSAAARRHSCSRRPPACLMQAQSALQQARSQAEMGTSTSRQPASRSLVRARARPRTAQAASLTSSASCSRMARTRKVPLGGSAARRPSYLKYGPGAGPARDPQRHHDPLTFHESPDGARSLAGSLGMPEPGAELHAGASAVTGVAKGRKKKVPLPRAPVAVLRSAVPRFCTGFSAGGARTSQHHADRLISPPVRSDVLYGAARVDHRASFARAHTAEPSHAWPAACTLGARARTPKELHPTMTATPPHPDWLKFNAVDYQLDLKRQAGRWTDGRAGKGVGGGGRTFGTLPPTMRGDPRRPDCRMHTRVLLMRSRSAKADHRAERAERGRLLRQSILDECGFFHASHGGNGGHQDDCREGSGIGGDQTVGRARIDGSGGVPHILSRADFMGAMHGMGLGLSFAQLQALAERCAVGSSPPAVPEPSKRAAVEHRARAAAATPVGFVDLHRFADSVFKKASPGDEAPNAFLLPLLRHRRREAAAREKDAAAAAAAACAAEIPEEVRVAEDLVRSLSLACRVCACCSSLTRRRHSCLSRFCFLC